MEPLYGVLDMLVLRTLLFGPRHGYGVAAAIRDSSRDAVTIEFGSLYPALKRLELKGWIASKWETSEQVRWIDDDSLETPSVPAAVAAARR
jgi:PadR family transcriptional regulator, regulatory protein PadR